MQNQTNNTIMDKSVPLAFKFILHAQQKSGSAILTQHTPVQYLNILWLIARMDI